MQSRCRTGTDDRLEVQEGGPGVLVGLELFPGSVEGEAVSTAYLCGRRCCTQFLLEVPHNKTALDNTLSPNIQTTSGTMAPKAAQPESVTALTPFAH